jgi:uncharacterized protein (DUF1501 family)
MRRRDFLRLLTAAPFAACAVPALAAALPARLLILVELKGGNDGLNTLVPHADPHYAGLRPRLAIARDTLLPVSDSEGLHPALARLMPAWEAGELAIVRGLGYPEPNLSHFRSIEIWDTASSSHDYLADGWLARALARRPSPAHFAADGVVVGAADLGPLSGGAARTIALTDPEQFLRSARLASSEAVSVANAALAHVLRVEADIRRSADRLRPGRGLSTAFPGGPFGTAVKTAAQLAAHPENALAIRITLNGFDTHANQLGTHAGLLRQLGEGLACLRAGLQEAGRWNDTLVATYAEFGRRPRENQSGGTDHGTASVHFVMGGGVNGGLHGEPPRLDRLDANGNPAFSVDFRSYYATLLRGAWGLDSAGILGAAFPALGFVKGPGAISKQV